MTPHRRLALLLVVPLLLVTAAACSRPRIAGSTKPFAPDDLVIRVVSVGGLVPTVYRYATLPVVSVYGDGRVFTQGAVPTIYPGPAAPLIEVRQVSADDLHALVLRALDAGVGGTDDLGLPNVMDAPSTRIDVRTDQGVLTTSVAALGIDDGGLTRSQRAARARLSALITEVTRAGTGAATTYQATTVAAFAEPYVADQNLPAPDEVTWAGPELPGPAMTGSAGVSCVTIPGADLAPGLARANAATPWTSSGQRFRLTLRPLLPDEHGCADLGR